MLTLNIFHTLFSVSTVESGLVNTYWVRGLYKLTEGKLLMLTLN